MGDHATKTYSGMELPTSEIDADFFVKVLDIDGDGVISEEEFVGFMEKYRSFDEEKRQEFANSSGAHLRIGNFAQKMIVVAREKYGVEIGNTFIMGALKTIGRVTVLDCVSAQRSGMKAEHSCCA